MPYANNKGVDQPVHSHSLITAFVVHFLYSIIPTLAKSKILRIFDLRHDKTVEMTSAHSDQSLLSACRNLGSVAACKAHSED